MPNRVNEPADILRALPAQLINVGSGIVVIRGNVEFYIEGSRAIEIVPILINAAMGSGISRDELIQLFAVSQDRVIADKLIDELLRRSIFYIKGNTEEESASILESNLDVFNWHFGNSLTDSSSKRCKKSIVILGVNAISRQIAISLKSLGLDDFQVVDFHSLRNLSLYDENDRLRKEEWSTAFPVPYEAWEEELVLEDIGCLVAACDFGCPDLMRVWNRFCVEQNVPFLPIVLNRMVGTLGPFVLPGETACFECLWFRENSNTDNYEFRHVIESFGSERQNVVGFHPAMTNVLAELAAMELTQYRNGRALWRTSHIIELKLLAPSIVSRRVLKLPRCPVCSKSVVTSAVNVDVDWIVPGHRSPAEG